MNNLELEYYAKYTIDDLERRFFNYKSKFDLLKTSSNFSGLNLYLDDDKIFIGNIYSRKPSVNIKIPDWVWDFGDSVALTDNIEDLTLTFTRPLLRSDIFIYCEYIKHIRLNNFDIRYSGTEGLFNGCYSLEHVEFDEGFNLGDSKSTSYMFCDCYNLKHIKSVNPFRISEKCENYAGMFIGCNELEIDIDMPDWVFRDKLFKSGG